MCLPIDISGELDVVPPEAVPGTGAPVERPEPSGAADPA
jgi:hypothetical protein